MNKASNFKVYQASAGAGKTFTLIKEYLKLCLKSANQVANYKSILAITFTNAAANEMKNKIIKALCEIIDAKELESNAMATVLSGELGIDLEELKSNAQLLLTNILHDYSSFCVSTIDTFVQKLSRSFAHDLGLPNQYSVSIDDDEVAEAITENLGMRISDKEDYLTRLLIDFSNNQFDNQRSTAIEDQLGIFIKKLMTEKAYEKDGNNGIKNAEQYKETLGFLNDKISDFEQGIKSFVDEYKAAERRYGLTENDYWYKKSGVCSFVNKLEKKSYESPNSYFNTALAKRKCLNDMSKVEANEALLAILRPLQEFYEVEHANYLFYKTQRDLLYLYALRAQIKLEFNQLANDDEVVHISEFNKLLNAVMGDFSVPFVYERIGEHFRHIFVDEFQDTSILQWQNLLPLIDNGLAAGEMSMVVGDGKQSIYRFRSGEVEQIVRLPDIYTLPSDQRKKAFEQYQDNLRNNFSFKNLDTNYRSFSNVIDFNNAFFDAAYKNLSTDSQKVYVAEKPGTEEGVSIFQKKAKKDEGLVQVELYDAETQTDYSIDRVAAIICELVKEHGYRYEDITVLTRKSDLGSRIANSLNDKGIPVISQDSILLKSSDKVQLIVSTLRYLIHDDNENDIANLLFYWNLSQSTIFDGVIDGYFDEVKRIATGEVAIETVMGIGDAGLLQEDLSKATCLYDLCATLSRIFHFDTIRDAFLNYFMEEVFKFQVGIKDGIADFLKYWDKKQGKLAVMSVDGNAVKIMTIHKSKGLEFPVVIYPEAIIDLDEKLNPSKVAEEWLHPCDLGFGAIPNLEKVLFKLDKTAESMGGKAREMCEKEKESNRLDNLNLLYVAFTRAVQRLYVIAKQGKEDKPNIILDFLAGKEEQLVSRNEAWIYRFGNPDFRNPKEKADEKDTVVLTDSISADWLQRISVDPNPTMVWQSTSDKLQPREFGELVHQLLAKIRTADEMEQMLRPFVSDGTIDVKTANWIRERFNQMAAHPLIGAAFDALAKVKTECEVLYRGEVLRLDRYAESPDTIYLIDYKTGRKHNDDYHKQVRAYADALKELTAKPIQAYLVYLSEETIDVEKVEKRASVSEGSLFIDFEY